MFDIFSDASWAEIAVVWLDVALKGMVLLAVAAVVSIAMRRAAASARHMVWLLAVVGLLLLPVLSVTLPGWQVLPRWANLSGEMQAVPVGEPVFESVAGLAAVSESTEVDAVASSSYSGMGEGGAGQGDFWFGSSGSGY